MNKKRHAYGGRVCFDHLPKTAGEAVRVWLTESLGNGCVSDHVDGGNRQIIKQYGGEYSILPGHFTFTGKGLDPRYQYITCLRDPIDRVVSWLYFVLKNHSEQSLPGVYSRVKEFIDSEGESDNKVFLGEISNQHVLHFLSVVDGAESFDLSDPAIIEKAFDVLKLYDVVGLFEEMPKFIAEVSNLIGISEPVELKRVNVTNSRPSVKKTSSKLLESLVELNQLDVTFYNKVVKWKKNNTQPSLPTISDSFWMSYERQTVVLEIDFKDPAYADSLLMVSGFSAFDRFGSWTNASLQKSAKLEFKEVFPEAFTLELTAGAFGPNVGKEITVRVGQSMQRFVVTDSREVQYFELEFNNVESENTIEIIPPEPTAPCELDPASKDKRKLGVRLVSLKIIEK